MARRSADGQAVLVGFQRRGEIALRHEHVADPLVGDERSRCQTALPGVGLGQAVGNGERLPRRLLLLGRVALGGIGLRELVQHGDLNTQQLQIVW